MPTTSNGSPSKYRWYILALGTATHIFVVAMSRMCMPVLFDEISEDLGLSLVQLGITWGMLGLAGLLTSFAYGLITDRYGPRLLLSLLCVLQGIAGALRGLSASFTSLAIYMFLFGLFTVPLAFCTHKTAAEWFSGRQLGLANGILAMGMGVGMTVGSMVSSTILSPLFGGWRNLMFVYGAVAVAIGFLWLQTRRRPSQGKAVHSGGTVPFRQSLAQVTRLRAAWFLALVQMCYFGCRSGLTGYLPMYLRGRGWSEVSADGALAALSVASVLGVIPLSLLSDRIGLRKVILYSATLAMIIGVGLLSVFGGVTVWPLVILCGIGIEAFAAILITVTLETHGIGAAYAGTALGLNMTFSGLGGLLAPPIGNRLAEINPSFAFLFWAALPVAALFLFHFVPETGWRKRRSMGDARFA